MRRSPIRLRGSRALSAAVLAVAIPACAQAAAQPHGASRTVRATVVSASGHTLHLTVGGRATTLSVSRLGKLVAGDLVGVTELRSGASWRASSVKVLRAVPSGPLVTTSATITAISRSSITVLLPKGSSLTLGVPADAVHYFTLHRKLRPCDIASITYQALGRSHALASLTPVGVTTSPSVAVSGGGNCATHSDGESDAVGTITRLSAASVTLAVAGGGQRTWTLAPGRDLQSNEAVGTMADVTYDPVSGIAYDLESSELLTTGLVTKLSFTSITIRDLVTGKTTTFPADAAAYLNINRGDRVDIVYWINAGRPRGDNASDLTTGIAN
jgi:hypothetical protein